MSGPNLKRSDTELAIKKLEGQVKHLENTITNLTSQNIDMHGRRVINAKPSRHDHDYIIRQELSSALEEARIGGPTFNDLKRFTLEFDVQRLNYGALTLNNIKFTKAGVETNIGDIDVDGLYVILATVEETDLSTQYQINTAIPGLTQEFIVTISEDPVNWAVGDYIVINDPVFVSGPDQHKFEIFKIKAVDHDTDLVTLLRDGSSAGVLTSWFGTLKSTHLTGLKAYKVCPNNFSFPFKAGIVYNPSSKSGYAQRADCIIPNVCVVGMYASIYNQDNFGNWVSLALDTGNPTGNQWESGDITAIVPGFRTLNGAAYYITTTGTLSVNLESDFTIRPNDYSPIRCLWGYLDTAGNTAGAGSTDTVITVDVIEIDEDTLAETVIETVIFEQDEIISGDSSYRPETRQVPYDPKPELVGDTAAYKWPFPNLDSNKRYKTKVTAIGVTVAGAGLIMVMST